MAVKFNEMRKPELQDEDNEESELGMGCSSVVEHVSIMWEVLCSIPRTFVHVHTNADKN
jgi:hypothetical protein